LGLCFCCLFCFRSLPVVFCCFLVCWYILVISLSRLFSGCQVARFCFVGCVLVLAGFCWLTVLWVSAVTLVSVCCSLFVLLLLFVDCGLSLRLLVWLFFVNCSLVGVHCVLFCVCLLILRWLRVVC
jgi:hypothetical protein